MWCRIYFFGRLLNWCLMQSWNRCWWKLWWCTKTNLWLQIFTIWLLYPLWRPLSRVWWWFWIQWIVRRQIYRIVWKTWGAKPWHCLPQDRFWQISYSCWADNESKQPYLDRCRFRRPMHSKLQRAAIVYLSCWRVLPLLEGPDIFRATWLGWKHIGSYNLISRPPFGWSLHFQLWLYLLMLRHELWNRHSWSPRILNVWHLQKLHRRWDRDDGGWLGENHLWGNHFIRELWYLAVFWHRKWQCCPRIHAHILSRIYQEWRPKQSRVSIPSLPIQ